MIFSCLLTKAQNITSPQIRCVDVLPSGGITVTWQLPTGPQAQFASYNIYTSQTLNNPSYTLQATITSYNTNSYTIGTIANTNTQPYFIYIETVTTTSVTLLPLDTIKTLFLSPVINGPVAQLIWQNFAKPMPPSEGGWYLILREYPQNTWTIIDSVRMNPNFTGNYYYNDTISICSDTISYRIELFDSLLHCTSVSNVRGGHFQDKNKPSAPFIDSVSVVNHFPLSPNMPPPDVVMGINSSYSQDVKCFIIHYFKNSTYNKIDSICNYNLDTLYSTTAYDPVQGSVSLSSLAQDSCALEQSVFPGNRQQTIYTNSSYDFCKKQATIHWTPYINMTTGVKYYEVFCSVNYGPPQLLGDTTATTYFQNNLTPGTLYIYYVRAHSNGKKTNGKDTASSTSNLSKLTTIDPPLPTLAYLSNVTVNPQQTIDISWYVKNNDHIGGFNLYRSTNKYGSYTLIKNMPFTSGNSNYSYTDENVNANSTEYFYYVVVLDSVCFLPAIQTDTSNNMVLTAIPSANLTATLNWNNYAKYAGNVSGYNIYRSVDGLFSGTPIKTVGAGTTSITDDLSPYADKEGMFVYYVEAVEGSGDSYGFAEKSTSNYDTVYIDANLYIPNAFVVDGHTKIFLPIGAFVDDADYKLAIYDRWGAKVYETDNVNTGWSGTNHPEGVYAYTVQYKTSLGEYRQRKGTVTLIK